LPGGRRARWSALDSPRNSGGGRDDRPAQENPEDQLHRRPITARKILEAGAQEIKPSVMELGGKSASLVFPDCDLQAAAERAVFWTVGCLASQGCALPMRQIVYADIYDEFVGKLQTMIACRNDSMPAPT